MLDVHPPHEPMHGIRDFLSHLLTITVGLLIALALEGLVEWRHHRHMVHEAEDGMRAEIARNAQSMPDALAKLHKQQETLKQDVAVLQYIVKNGRAPEKSSLEISFGLHSLDSVSWKTAQSTGALSYMSYDEARMYAEIYATQDRLTAAEDQAARDAIIGLGVFMDTPDGASITDPTGGHAAETVSKIQVLQGQLLLVEQLYKTFNESCTKYLQSHPS